jgi:hypothetical protein
MGSLPDGLNREVLKGILSHPTWNFVQEAIVATRRYEEGLEAGKSLLRYVEGIREDLPQQEYSDYAQKLNSFILMMLDKADMWEEYLATWQSVRETTDFFRTYSASSRTGHGSRFEPFILGAEGESLRVHFLWLTLHRKEVIERKAERARAGKKLGNLMHGTHSELSAAEVRRRIEWISKIAEAEIRRTREGRQ